MQLRDLLKQLIIIQVQIIHRQQSNFHSSYKRSWLNRVRYLSLWSVFSPFAGFVAVMRDISPPRLLGTNLLICPFRLQRRNKREATHQFLLENSDALICFLTGLTVNMLREAYNPGLNLLGPQ